MEYKKLFAHIEQTKWGVQVWQNCDGSCGNDDCTGHVLATTKTVNDALAHCKQSDWEAYIVPQEAA